MKFVKVTSFKAKNKGSQKKKLLVGMILFILLLLTTIFLTRGLLNHPYVYSGVYLDGVSLGGMDKAHLMSWLENKNSQDPSSMELSIFHKAYPLTVTFEEMGIHVDTQSMFNRVYACGRQGNFIQRLLEIYRLQKNRLYLETVVSMNEAVLETLMDDIYNKTLVPAQPPALIILEDEVSIQSGISGYQVNRERLKKRILGQLRKLQSGVVIVPVEEIPPSKIDADSFYKEIVREPQDAAIHPADGKIEIIPEVVGRSLDKPAFLSLVAELEAKSNRYPKELKLPVTFTQPDQTTEIIEASVFIDSLASYATTFSVQTDNDRNRANNMRLAVEAIDGTIVMPGELFSFNETVGRRTASMGYRVANIYSSDGITTGIGGGVCQVSSTLYNVALKANMQILERNPHIYTVAYVPLGCDAAVNYGSEDFRFTNTTRWPLRIDGEVTENMVQFTFIGTDENPSLHVVIQPSVVKYLPYPTEYVEDPSLAAGSSIVEQAGMYGAVVDTYHSLRGTQGLISSHKLHSTSYLALPEIIHVAPGETN